MLTHLENGNAVELATRWLGHADNSKWLDLGAGPQLSLPDGGGPATPRNGQETRLFVEDDFASPAGIVGLSEISQRFRTATLWVVLGDKRLAGRGLATRACAAMLELGFRDLSLRAVRSWVVDGNAVALRIIDKLGFRYAGRLRNCHDIDGRVRDRLLFDLLVNECNARLAT